MSSCSSIPPSSADFSSKRDLKAAVGERQGGGHAADAAPDHDGPGVHLGLDRLLRLEQGGLGHAHADEVLGLAGAVFLLLHVNPRALVADVHHLEEVRVETGLGAGAAEQRLVGARGAGGDDHAVELLFLDSGLDLVDPAFRAGVQVFFDIDDVGQRLRVLGQLLHIKVAGDIAAAVANKNCRCLFHLPMEHLILGLSAYSLQPTALRIGDGLRGAGRGRAAGLSHRFGNIHGSLGTAAHINTGPVGVQAA